MQINAFTLAQRFIGTAEVPGLSSNPLVLAMLRLDSASITDDAVPWCSAFANFVAWLLRAPRSKSLAARSWLVAARPVKMPEARVGWDIVVLKRGPGMNQPGPEVIDAPGHVGFFAGWEGSNVLLLGGNQGDRVSIEAFPVKDILGIRRLVDEVA